MQILELTLQTPQIAPMLAFYTEVLELVVIQANDKEFSLSIGQTRLSFQAAREQAYYHFAFNIPAGEIETARQWLRGRVQLLPFQGKEILDFPNWQARALYFFDPVGNIVELIARDAVPGPPVSSEMPPAFLSVSEIGLPTPKVDLLVQELEDQYGLPHYDGDRQRFSALGDPEGLFIVVKEEEKNWLPTHIPARSFPTMVRFRHDQKESLLEV